MSVELQKVFATHLFNFEKKKLYCKDLLSETIVTVNAEIEADGQCPLNDLMYCLWTHPGNSQLNVWFQGRMHPEKFQLDQIKNADLWPLLTLICVITEKLPDS